MEIRFATSKEIKNWDDLILQNPDGGNVFQSVEMSNFKLESGWQQQFLVVESEAENLYITIQEKSVFLLGKLWYAPKGPGVENSSEIWQIAPLLKQFAHKQGVFAVKIEPEIIKYDNFQTDFSKHGFVQTRPIQPNFSTIILDISGTDEEILSSMPRKGAKYSINRARRDGVTVKRVESTDENCRIFYDLLAETAADSGFKIRDSDYHRRFWRDFTSAKIGQLFFAYFDGQVVAAAYAFIFGEKSTYKDGASVRQRTAYGASHLLQWGVINWARENGAKQHDLCGTPPSNKIHDKNHPHYGIGNFKTSFSREITDYIGAFDLPVRKFKYKIWAKFGEKLALRIHRARHNGENWY
ncbi:MAG: peptidoglycan bridge formation glycyltransferase FemA/FemB family protein [Candidatus Sacchiramonaceae bacterium]|nr:peptidoglycan bridge formation glycyltransferase FemA/FemB family protein [Candidatus Saccharimonadaceae bacterium]